MTLEKAVSLLPESAAGGRIDRFSAKALLAKVYLETADIAPEVRIFVTGNHHCSLTAHIDFVRLSYYDPQRAINELKSQKRSYYNGLDELYKTY